MKKIKLFLYVAAVSMLAAACDDAIDITQPSELPPERAFETVEDLQKGILAVYASVPGENIIAFTSLFTDEVKIGRSNGGQGTDGELAFLLNNNSGDAASIWGSNYLLINRANRLLAGATNVTPDENNEFAYNNVIAEAKILRAYGHFQLETFFSTNMKDDAALGVIIMDHVPTISEKPARNTNGEVFAFIDQDLADAEAIMGNSSVRLGRSGYLDIHTINAFRARMAVYRGKYDVAENIIDTKFGAFPLAAKGTLAGTDFGNPTALKSKSNYFKMFRDEAITNQGQDEVIFRLIRTVAATEVSGNFFQVWSNVNSSTAGSAFFEVGTSLFTKLSPEDVRRTVVVDPSAFPSFLIRPVGKYAESKSVPLLGDLKLFRMSEMVLLKAECRANAGDWAGVATQVNRIRTARFGNANSNIGTPATAQAGWAAILDERRIEFAFEGFRYIDIKRLGALAGKGIDRDQNDYAFNGAFDLPLDDHRWTLPIPRGEITGNPNIQQNPGY